MMTLKALAAAALAEDIGPGDITSQSCLPADQPGRARIFAKQSLVVSGLDIAAEVFAARGCALTRVADDGDSLEYGDDLAHIEGPVQDLLIAERVALNFLMRLSGIATNTAGVVAAAQGKIRVVDTRKTTPLHRLVEKAAVRHGGGYNHRFALYDGVMIKDNHIVAAGGIRPAVAAVRANAHHLVRIEVEVEDMVQLAEALDCGADVLLLDNMDDAAIDAAVAAVAGRAITEASGNMTAERIRALADLAHPPDIVSVGGLIHQARWVDLSMRMIV